MHVVRSATTLAPFWHHLQALIVHVDDGSAWTADSRHPAERWLIDISSLVGGHPIWSRS
jgi:hypothetical protein